MNATGFVKTISEGLDRINNETINYALLIEYSQAKYIESKRCDLMTNGDQIAKKSFGKF